MNDFKKMPLTELRQYVLANRQDTEAWEEFTARPRPNAVIIPSDAKSEDAESILREAISRTTNF